MLSSLNYFEYYSKVITGCLFVLFNFQSPCSSLLSRLVFARLKRLIYYITLSFFCQEFFEIFLNFLKLFFKEADTSCPPGSCHQSPQTGSQPAFQRFSFSPLEECSYILSHFPARVNGIFCIFSVSAVSIHFSAFYGNITAFS